MPLDPSIYSQVGRVNLGQGLSDIINQQRQREAENEQRQLTLASLAQQREALKQAQTQKRNQELNMWLSSAVQSGRPIEEVLPEAIAKGSEIGVSPEITQRHVTNVYGQVTPQARSDVAFTQAYPELVAKQRAESMFARPASQAAPSNVGKLLQEREMLPPNDPRRAMYDAAIRKETEIATAVTKPADEIARQRLALEQQKFEFEKTKPQKAAQLSPTAQKELFEAEDTIQSSKNVIGILNEALKINDKAYSGAYATERAIARSNLPGTDEAADATINLNNMMTGQALESLKATFGGMPTEGERKILLDIQAAPNKTPAQRKMIIERAQKAAEVRIKFNEERAKKLRSGEYFTDTQAPQTSTPQTVQPTQQGGVKFLGFE